MLGSALNGLEVLLADNRVRHNQCPLMAANVNWLRVTETVGGNRRIGKGDAGLSGQGSEKIDGVAAVLSGFHLIEQQTTAWDAGGLIG